MRIDRLLANNNYGSRREIKALLKQGRVRYADRIITDPGYQLPDELSCLRTLLYIDGAPLAPLRRYLYYLLNKPAGYLTAMRDGRQATIQSLLPADFITKKVSPVGRLDKDTTGLIILSNNGELQHRLLAPKYVVPRRYEVTVSPDSRPFVPEDGTALETGIRLNAEETARPARLEIISDFSAVLTLTEGKFHEVKRMMHALGKEVIRLHRPAYGPIHLSDEAQGSYRELSGNEIKALFETVGLDILNA